MTPHPRPQLTSFQTHLSMTLIGVAVGLMVLAIYLVVLLLFDDYLYVFILFIISPAIVGFALDKRARYAAETELLDQLGMTPVEFDNLEQELKLCIDSIPAFSIGFHYSIKHAYRTQIHNRDVVIIRSEIEYGEHTCGYTLCAIQTQSHLPKAIVRRRMFKDRYPLYRDKHEHPVGKSHVIVSREQNMIETLRSISDWFKITKRNPWRLYFNWPPERGENFSMFGDWVLYAAIGSAGPESLKQLTEFTHHFACALENAYETQLASNE